MNKLPSCSWEFFHTTNVHIFFRFLCIFLFKFCVFLIMIKPYNSLIKIDTCYISDNKEKLLLF